MRYIILSVTRRRKEKSISFYCAYVLLFLWIRFVKKVLLTTTSVLFYFRNFHSFVITDIDTFSEKKVFKKLPQAVKIMFRVYFSVPQKKLDGRQSVGGTEFVQVRNKYRIPGFCFRFILRLFSLLFPGLNYLIMQ